MAKNDGGPAFPGGDGAYGGGPNHAQGMSLRDWFAGQALASIANNTGLLSAARKQGLGVCVVAAVAAYEYADAMLAEREKGGAK